MMPRNTKVTSIMHSITLHVVISTTLCRFNNYIKKSGGIFKDMMIHDFDLARYYAGNDKFEHIFATGNNVVATNLVIGMYAA